MSTLIFEPPVVRAAKKMVFIGRKGALLSKTAQSLLPSDFAIDLWTALVESCNAGDNGDLASATFLEDGQLAAIVAAVLPEICSRHNSRVRPHEVTALVRSAVGSAPEAAVFVMLDDAKYAGGVACAIGRAFPLYSRKMQNRSEKQNVIPVIRVSFATILDDGYLRDASSYRVWQTAANAVRFAARLVDMPPAELTTSAFVAEAREVVERLAAKGRVVQMDVVRGKDLETGGYGFLYAVGKAAEDPPVLIVLSALPSHGNASTTRKTVAFVGKGIVYDTGGLGLKSKDEMCSMKSDMSGAAAQLAAFEAAVEIGLGDTALHVVLCVAENAIGPAAVRHDDVITCLSGKTCEVNNTDAEGRLVLSDGVAHATALPPRLPGLTGQPDLVADFATLTGAQMIATGMRHAAIVSNSDEIDRVAVQAGLLSGDMVHPLLFVPEFHRAEFKSEIADMKNSVKDRNNAQVSCAANFIAEHLHPEYKGGWLHVDLAGPSFIDDRGTGFGVGLALALLEIDGFRPPQDRKAALSSGAANRARL
eukprot:TRINITY_DN4342_c0_g1_i2.p1 TRINITY_DN4342_c0_g1~~TRINITY_DN4342_c0_g1_i2.p1  ORF type:complete len:534 (+),score=99.95 TRINITY_DN4342_c0_g1_i2:89-1690(+)